MSQRTFVGKTDYLFAVPRFQLQSGVWASSSRSIIEFLAASEASSVASTKRACCDWECSVLFWILDCGALTRQSWFDMVSRIPVDVQFGILLQDNRRYSLDK